MLSLFMAMARINMHKYPHPGQLVLAHGTCKYTQYLHGMQASVFHACMPPTVSLKQGGHITLSLSTALIAVAGVPPTQGSSGWQRLPLCPSWGGTTDADALRPWASK